MQQTSIFSLRTVLLYGLSLGLLLASFQAARYRFLVLEHSEEVYYGLIAACFAAIGIWLGRRVFATKEKTPALVSAEPLQGAELEQALAQHRVTQREYEVLLHIAQGLSNQQIADTMFVSLNTVKTHTANLFSKLDAQRRTQLVERARVLGLIAPIAQKYD
ncbi:MAG: response regulator transcription factor [Saprospiraceae bacterium]